nr:hypothetical protein [Tanacetum cinerariifolium]
SCCFYAESVFFRAWLETATSPPRNAVVTLIISSIDFGMLSCRRFTSSRSLKSTHFLQLSSCFFTITGFDNQLWASFSNIQSMLCYVSHNHCHVLSSSDGGRLGCRSRDHRTFEWDNLAASQSRVMVEG